MTGALVGKALLYNLKMLTGVRNSWHVPIDSKESIR